MRYKYDIMLYTKKWVPITYSAFIDYRVGGVTFVKRKIVIQKIINNQNISIESSGLSKREWNELMDTMELDDRKV